VALVALERLRPWPGNPRKIAGRRFEELKRALKADPEMLWARPLLALPDGTVFCGNQRLLAALELGWTSIPLVFVDIDLARATVWALRDNSSWGEWDEELLTEILAELERSGVELALTGFENRDLDRLLGGIGTANDPDQLPPARTGRPRSKRGERYRLGAHVLVCGDATDAAQLEEALEGEQADLLLSDPPWGVDYVGKTSEQLRITNDDAAGVSRLLPAAFSAIAAVLAPGAPFYIFSPAGPAGTEFRLAIRDAGWNLRQELVWVKDSIVLGRSDYHYRHESILFGYSAGSGRPGRGRSRASRWYGGNDQGSVLFADRPKRSDEHPTAKPADLLCGLIRNSSRRGGLVLDPFAGSGSTLIACEMLGRRCVAVELEPRYADVIRDRYEAYTHA
jgi:site-specific DNA-methyltransferase (adenine-specific)